MTLRVVDISSHQGENGIAPGQLDCDAVIVKASGGTSYRNPYFKRHVDDVLASGKLLGIYHYAMEYGRYNEPEDEARYFLDTVRDYVGRAVIALDFEADAQDLPVSWAKRWLDHVERETGATPWFYAYASYLNSRDHSPLARFPLWMASYLYRYYYGGWVDDPQNVWPTSAWGSMTAYQYASTGRIGGYGGNLDLSVFYGTRDDWKRMEGGYMADNAQMVDYLMPISTRYVFGGSRWEPYDTDCSGVVDAAFWHVHKLSPYELGTWTGDMWTSDATEEIWRGTTPDLPWHIMRKGDIIFSGNTTPDFSTGNGSHVGFYTGDPSAPFLSHFRDGGPEMTGMRGVYGNERYFGVKRYTKGDIDMTPEQAAQLEFIYNHLHWRDSDHFSDLGNLVAEFPVEYETVDEEGNKQPLTQPLAKRIGYMDQRIHVMEANQAAMGEKLDEILKALTNGEDDAK